MKLFLTSSTITKNLVKDFEDLLGKSIIGLKVAFVPDAADGVPSNNDKSWVEEERQDLIDWYAWDITDFNLKELNPEDLKKLRSFEVIFVNGGFSGHLANMMRKSGFDKILPQLLEEGIVYVGSSAGSMVMSGIQEASSWYLGEPEPEAIDIPGLGYIDFQIYPHVKDETIETIKAHCKPNYTYYLLRDGTAISINKTRLQVCGEKVERIN